MWIPKTKWAGAVMALVIICFAFVQCTGKADAEESVIEPEAVAMDEAEEISDAETVTEDIAPEPEAIENQDMETPVITESITKSEVQTPSAGTSNTTTSSTQTAPAPASAPAPTPAPAPAAPKYSIVGPDGRTYTGSEPMYIICLCGAKFGSGAEWQSHRDYYSVFRCSCGATFAGIGEWEAHAGIYDPTTWMYTGKTRAEAASEGHTLTNEGSYTSDYNAHNGWRTSNFTG